MLSNDLVVLSTCGGREMTFVLSSLLVSIDDGRFGIWIVNGALYLDGNVVVLFIEAVVPGSLDYCFDNT